jgi:cytochrome c-type biogenesis protein CcmH/NrfG
VSGRDHGECLTEETLTEYLEGGLDPAIKAVTEVHLVACEHCREQLAFFMRVLQPEVTAEEAAALQTISAEWDRRKASERLPQRKPLLPRFIAIASVAAVLLIAVGALWIGTRSTEPASGTEIVQLLLEGGRPFEARMADQPHRTIFQTRGPEDGGGGVSLGLLEAEMARLSASDYEMGRFYLLQKNFNRAISYLERAERESDAPASVHNDLGVAYLENGNISEMGKAEAEFRHALEKDNAFGPAVFNLALFYEQTNAPEKAEGEWKRYLELDSRSDWATEAQGKLQGLIR